MALPVGARLLGAPLGRSLALAPDIAMTLIPTAKIDGKNLDGVALIGSDDSDYRANQLVSTFTVVPAPGQSATMICRYGPSSDPPLRANSVLLIPIAPHDGGYRCTVQTPPDGGRQPTRASCIAR